MYKTYENNVTPSYVTAINNFIMTGDCNSRTKRTKVCLSLYYDSTFGCLEFKMHTNSSNEGN